MKERSMSVSAGPDSGKWSVSRRYSRRAALLAPLALAACETIDGWFGTKKTPLTGKREPVQSARHGMTPDEGARKIVLPPPVRNAAWPQDGGNPAHVMGHLAVNERLSQAWSASIGDGGGYRRKILAQPVVADGTVFAMDSDGTVSAFSLAGGSRLWRFDTKDEDADSPNVGGGLAVDQGTVYAANGLGELIALDAAKGMVRWRKALGAPSRSAPTAAEGRLFITTIDDRLLALAAEDGRSLWNHRGAGAGTALLGQPAPAYSRGLLAVGFGSGEVAALRADTGSVLWTDGLGSAASLRSGLVDFTAIRGAPVISGGVVFAVGMGGLTAAIDLPSGRRLWERRIGGENTLCVAGDWVFMVSLEQEMVALDAADGRVAWVSPLPRWGNEEKRKDPLTWYGPVLAGDRLVVTGNSEQAVSVSPYTGAILGQQSLSGAASPVSPVVADGTLIVVSDDARLLALR
jgi:outer membrane protein assembly factor BamB